MVKYFNLIPTSNSMWTSKKVYNYIENYLPSLKITICLKEFCSVNLSFILSSFLLIILVFSFLSCMSNVTRVSELFILVYTFGFLSCMPNVTCVSELFILVYTFGFLSCMPNVTVSLNCSFLFTPSVFSELFILVYTFGFL
jgi:hypothetical protein